MVLRQRMQVGLDPSAEAVRAVVSRGGEPVAGVQVPVLPGSVSRADATERVLAAIERQGLGRPKSCVAVAPLDSVVSAVVELPPPSSGAPISQLAAAELSRGTGGAGLEVAAFPIDRNAQGSTSYLVTGAQRETTMQLVEELDALGVELEVVDAPLCSIARACGVGSRMIADVGREALCLHTIHEGRPGLSRVFRFGASALSSASVVGEIDRCAAFLSSYGGATHIDEIVVVGAGEGLAEHAKTIESEFGVPVRVWSRNLIGGGELGAAFAAAYGASAWTLSREVAA